MTTHFTIETQRHKPQTGKRSGLLRVFVPLWFTGLFLGLAPATVAAPAPLPMFEEALAAKRDVWGEAAMAQPNGASYEFFAPLLPPPRYVHADFRHYPIVLSAPNAKVKARLISNGSGVNLRGGARSWHDAATPFAFRVGPDEFLFGTLQERTSEPALAEGWLPIVEVRYEHRSPVQSEGAVPLNHQRTTRPPEIYRVEAFASTEPVLADHGVVFARFDLAQGTAGNVAVTVDEHGPLKFANGRLLNERGEILAVFTGAWKWERQRITARVVAGSAVSVAIATKPLPPAVADAARFDYAPQRGAAVATWRAILARGMEVRVPEPLVNDAWRVLLAQNFSLINGDRMHYSAGNQYDQLYEAEGSETVLALLAWGYAADTRRLLPPLLDFTRKGLEHHQAGFKIGDVVRYWWLTRDTDGVRALRPRWEKEARLLADTRTGPHGLYPPGRYAGDISTPVQAIGANANGWRALRDLGALLGELGESAESARLLATAREARANLLAVVDRSVRRDTEPPFIPNALLGDEPVHSPILHSRIGSYWNIIIGYTLSSGLFPPGDPREAWLPRYQEQHGGLFMGMVRSGGDQFNFWPSEQRVNPLYGTRYALDTLRRDDPERALASFYGMLAQGFTRRTFVAGEGTALQPYDARGRVFYCPPNSAANAHFLAMLRGLLVQDPDTDDDGRPDTLRLLFATPRRWLEDGKTITVERAPTAFGEVSVRMESKLATGEILAEVTLPTRNPPQRILLRARVPEGWKVISARTDNGALVLDADGTVDLTKLRGKGSVLFQASQSR